MPGGVPHTHVKLPLTSTVTVRGDRCRDESGAWSVIRDPGGGVLLDSGSRVHDQSIAVIGGAVELLEAQVAVVALSDRLRHVLAGAFARTMAQALVHPIDTIKTRLQVRFPPEAVRNWKKTIKANAFELQLAKKIFKFKNFLIKGPRDVYLGLTGAVVGTLPTAMVYFATYEAMQMWIVGQRNGCSEAATTHLISASAGALTSAAIRVPTDTMRHRVQAYLYPSFFQAGVCIAQKEGLKGLYSGFLPTLLRDVPEIGIQFALYEGLRAHIAHHREQHKLQTWEHLLLGGWCGACAAIVTMPLDVAKTTLQCGHTNLPLCQALTHTVQQKGVKGLFAGLYPRVTQVAAMSAVFFALFEFWKLQLKPVRFRDAEDSLLGPKLYAKERSSVWKRQFLVE